MTKKIPAARKFPPPPDSFSNGPFLGTQKGVRLCLAFLAQTAETGTKNCTEIEVTHVLRRKIKKD